MRNILYKMRVLFEKKQKIFLVLLALYFLSAILELLSITLIIPFVYLLFSLDFSNIMYAVLIETNMLKKIAYNVLIYINTELGWHKEQILIFVVLGIIFLYTIRFIVIISMQFYIISITKRLYGEMQSEFLSAYYYAPYLFQIQRSPSQMNFYINIALQHITEFLALLLMLINDMLFILLIGTFLIIVQKAVLAMIVVFLLSSLILYWITKKISTRTGTRQHEAESLKNTVWHHTVHNILYGKLYNIEKYFLNTFYNTTRQTMHIQAKSQTLQLLPRYYIETLLVVSFLLFCLLFFLFSDRNIVSLVTSLGIVFIVSLRLLPAFVRALQVFSKKEIMRPYIDSTYTEYLLIRPYISISQKKENATAPSPLPFTHTLYAKNISFTYPNNVPQNAKETLYNVSINIPQGSRIGIIGKSGSGKTTLVHLLMGLFPPDSGDIFVDEKSIKDNLAAWQSTIGYVPQDMYIMNQSIRRNIAIGIEEEDINDKIIWDVLQLSHLADYVQSLPKQLDTTIGERGVQLSGGQRQRIGVARALYRNPSILFFDEATSNLDPIIEKEVQDSISTLPKSKTVIIITHRWQALQLCDTIYWIEDNTISHKGTYTEMMAFLKRKKLNTQIL